MKETVKTSRTAGYLEKIFRALNAKYFNGELEEPIITIQSTPRAYGHVTVAKAWQRGDTTRHELNIGAGTLARPIENVVATTLHECVHLWNLQNGIQDCSRGGQYHNKKFKEAAEARDLKISYDPRIGWSIVLHLLGLLLCVLLFGGVRQKLNHAGSIPAGHLFGVNFIIGGQFVDKRNLLTGDGLPVPFVTLLFVPYMLLLRMVLLEVLINIIQHKLQWNGTSGALFIFAQMPQRLR